MSKYLPFGTKFTINGQQVGNLTSVSIPDRSRGEAEVTDSDSALAGGYREFIPGLKDPGNVELGMRHNPEDAGQRELEDNFDLDSIAAVVSCQIELPDDSVSSSGIARFYTFDGYVSAPPQGDLGLVDDEPANVTATVRVSGAVTLSSS